MNIIETKKLTKFYGKERGIIDLDMEIMKGEIFGFIGPNGPGKSTTIRPILSIIHPTRGSATIFGKDVTKFGPDIRQDIGYLPSEVYYYDNMKVIDLLRYSASFYDKPKSQTGARIKELSDLLDLDLHKKIDNLSYGNKKKVGIVQGLLHEPKLIILDEANFYKYSQKFHKIYFGENKNHKLKVSRDWELTKTNLKKTKFVYEIFDRKSKKIKIVKDAENEQYVSVEKLQKYFGSEWNLEIYGDYNVNSKFNKKESSRIIPVFFREID